jgi:hypothetical protein
LDEITIKLLTPAPTEEEQNKQDADVILRQPTPAVIESVDAPRIKTPEEEAEEEAEDLLEKPTVVENDYLEKAGSLPPQDPEGANCLLPDLILTKERIMEILNKALDITMDWLIQEQQIYHQKCIEEGKTLQD